MLYLFGLAIHVFASASRAQEQVFLMIDLLIVIRWRLQALVHPAIRAWLDQYGLAAP